MRIQLGEFQLGETQLGESQLGEFQIRESQLGIRNQQLNKKNKKIHFFSP